MGVALGYALLALDSLARGIDKLEVNRAALAADLDDAWEVLAEPIQTVMRRYGLPNPYEQLKELTRGKAITRATLAAFIEGLDAARGREGAPAGADSRRLHRQGGRAGAAPAAPGAGSRVGRRRAALPAGGARMSFTDQLAEARAATDTLLCVGLDPEPARFPGAWAGDASRIFDFCAAIVDATKDLVLAFKPQIAYFAAHRAEGQLEQLIAHIHAARPRACR